ncbi:MAG: hypothetical protein J6X72_04805 [Clostridia bacterium]|nr:hypothetical protein [Clostridia bacterium]
MKNPLSYEIGCKYEKTYALYQSGEDKTPVASATFSVDNRISIRRILIAAAVAAGALLFDAVAAELDSPTAKK